MRQRAALVAMAAALALGACDDDDEAATPSGPDPAVLAPADAVLYAEGLVRPEGDRAEEIESALASLLGDDDPSATIIDQIQTGLAEEGTELSYADDVEPWLGERAGIFFADFEREANGAAILASTDEEEARAALDRLAEQEGVASEGSYEDVAYTVTDEDTALGIVDGFAVIGSEPGFEAAVDASRGDSLAGSDEFEEVAADARAEGVITAYADPQTLLEELVAAGEITTQQRTAVAESAAGRLDEPVVLSGGAEDAGLYLELATAAGAAGATQSDLLESLPADPSIAFAFADLGEKLAPALAGVSVADLDRFEATTGLDPTATAESLGDVGGYLRGTSIFDLGGALVVEIADAQAANDLLSALRARFAGNPSLTVQPGDDEGEAFSVSPAGLPLEFPFVLRDGLVVAGLGEGSVEQVFAPESSLTDSDAEAAATSALGDGFELSALVDFEPLLELLEGIPGGTDDPDLQAALPYLERSDLLAAGVRESGDRVSHRLSLELDQEAEE